MYLVLGPGHGSGDGAAVQEECRLRSVWRPVDGGRRLEEKHQLFPWRSGSSSRQECSSELLTSQDLTLALNSLTEVLS